MTINPFKKPSRPLYVYNPLIVFPARTDKRPLTVKNNKDLLNAGIMGGVLTSKTGETIASLPPGNTAYERTVRLHESDHLRFSKRRCDYGQSPLVNQHIEDARISQLPIWKHRPKSVIRDAATAALRELRGIIRNWPRLAQAYGSVPPEVYNAALCHCLRDLALLFMANSSGVNICNVYRKVFAALHALKLPIHDLSNIARDCRTASAQALKEAAKDLQKLLVAVDKRPPTPHDNDGIPCCPNEVISGDAPDSRPMTIRKLPLTMACNPKAEQDDEGPAQFGYRINSRALPSVAMGLPCQPFIRKTTQVHAGGTLLIDASGSMEWDFDELETICKTAPSATVAYYCGNAEMTQGELVIYAKDGRRSIDIGNPMGIENVVDLPAVRWLLAQDSPRVLISDLNFHSPCGTDTNEATRLVSSAVASKELTVCGDSEEALSLFKQLSKPA